MPAVPLRLFTAVEPPTAVKSLLLSLRANIPGLKWTRESGLHLTLRFIGETPHDKLAAVKTALVSVVVPCFSLNLNELGLFERPHQTILWAGLEMCPELAVLKRGVDEALAASMGLAPDQGRFSPHITLGRLKGPASEALRLFVRDHSPQAGARFAVTAFTLFSSALQPSGAVHSPEGVYPLREAK